MDRTIEETLIELLGNAGAAAQQSDILQAAALTRQELAFRRRAGAAAARLRQATIDGTGREEIATLTGELEKRNLRLEAATVQARSADIKRPLPDDALAQVFGRASDAGDCTKPPEIENPPLTAAALGADGKVRAQAVVRSTGTFHITHEGDLPDTTLQISDAKGQVLYRAAEPATLPAGTVTYLDISLGEPRPEPGPVPPRAKMPDLTGQMEGVALAILHRLGVADVEITDQVGDGPPDVVIAQSPAAGTELREDTRVVLTVRRSGEVPAPKTLPDLVGSTLATAQKALEKLGLQVSLEFRPDDGPPNVVLEQKPPGGTPLEQVTTVTLLVSRKREAPPETVVVPDLVGKSLDLARELLKAADLEVEVSETTDASQPAGVTAQDPRAGTVARRGSTVAITVNVPPVVQPTAVVVPNVVGRKLAEARQILARVRLEVVVETVPDAAPADQVIGQDPPANERVPAGSSVVLKVSSGRDGGREVPRELTTLARQMATDPRAVEAGWSAMQIVAMLQTGNVTSLDDARALSELEPPKVRERLGLATQALATTFRAVMIKALRAIG